MTRTRPVLGIVVATLFCACLQGAVVSKAGPDAGWLAATAVLQAITLPLAVLIGLILMLGPPAATAARGLQAGILAGVGIYLAPSVAALFPAAPMPWAGWVAIFLWSAGSFLWMVRGPEASADARPGWLMRIALAIGLVTGALGWILPPPVPAIGRMPQENEPPPRPAVEGAPNIALVFVTDSIALSDSLPFSEQGTRYPSVIAVADDAKAAVATLLTGLAPDRHEVSNATKRVPRFGATLPSRLADAGYSSLAVIGHESLRRMHGFTQGFHLYDDTFVGNVGYSAAIREICTLTGVGRTLGGLPRGDSTWADWAVAHWRTTGNVAANSDLNATLLARVSEAPPNRPWFAFAQVPNTDGANSTVTTLIQAFEEAAPERPWFLVLVSRSTDGGDTRLFVASSYDPSTQVIDEDVRVLDVPGTILAAGGVDERLPESEGGVLPGWTAAELPTYGTHARD